MLKRFAYTAVLVLCLGVVAQGATSVTVETGVYRSDVIPPDFASFSVEVGCAKVLLSLQDGSAAPRVSYLNLNDNLRNTSRTTRGPNLRIGGDSSDRSLYRTNCTTEKVPSGMYCVSPSDLKAFEYYATINGSITIGLNLGYNVAQEAVNYASAVHALVRPSSLIEAYEIGNEPDLYMDNGLRPTTYNYTDYARDFATWFDALRSNTTLTFPTIQGAVFCSSHFQGDLDGYMKEYESKGFFKSVSFHHYPLTACGGHVSTLAELLEPHTATSVSYLGKYADVSRHFGKPFFVGEGNSVSCGGTSGVSNTFGATLWSIDTLFNAAVAGITRWNFHGCTGGPYSPVWLEETGGASDSQADTRYAKAQPLYYGMWAFTDTVAAGSRVVNATISSDADPALVVWSARSENWASQEVPSANGRSCRVRIVTVILDKRFPNATTSEAVDLRFYGLTSTKGPQAAVSVMAPSADGVTATGDITFAGRTLEGSTTGIPTGTRNTTLVAITNEAVTITSHAGTATFVEVYDDCTS